MTPSTATVLYAVGATVLFVLARNDKERTSKALWIPVVWLLIVGSRPVSAWLQPEAGLNTLNPDQYLDGSPLDRLVLSCLVAAGVIVLVGRGLQVGNLLRRNAAIMLFFAYCAASVLWSDYSFVASKRWIKAIGDLVMAIIVITDPKPVEALKRLLARVGFVLLPASVLLIKYYPALGRKFVIVNIADWEIMPIGVTEHKNTLGMLCMVLGLGFMWCFLTTYQRRNEMQRRSHLLAYGTAIAMAIWVFVQANSMTSLSCFLIATAFLLIISTQVVARKPWLVSVLLIVVVAVPVAALFLGIGSGVVQEMGRDATLTGRTYLWEQVLRMTGNPILGTGFESFWLGDRVNLLWQLFNFHPTQAHNGYLEVYLELGWIGVLLLAAIIVTGYKNALAVFRSTPDAGRIRLTYIVVGLLYNLTEAGFRMLTLTWFFFLMSAVVVVSRTVVPETQSPLTADRSRALDEWPAGEVPVSHAGRRRLEAL